MPDYTIEEIEERTKQFYAEHHYLVFDMYGGFPTGFVLPPKIFGKSWQFMGQAVWVVNGPATEAEYDELTTYTMGKAGMRRQGGTLYRVVAAD